MKRAALFLSLNLAGISLTASYIIWLHLKEGVHLRTSEWGEALMTLAALAAVLVFLRVAHTIVLWMRLRVGFSAFVLGAEGAFALAVIHASSVIMLVTPPPHDARQHIDTVHSQGVSVTLERSRMREELLVLVDGAPTTPIVHIEDAQHTALTPDVVERFEGGFALPHTLFGQGDAWRIVVHVPQEGAYSATARFSLERRDVFADEAGHGRSFDVFALAMLLVALSGVVLALALAYVVRRAPDVDREGARILPALGGVLVGFYFAGLITLVAPIVLGNQFKRECLADGNQWHYMMPLLDGVPLSAVAREGCMTANHQHHITDRREYLHLREALKEGASSESHGH